MDSSKILDSAKQTIREAIQLDNAGNHTDAYAKYQSALDKFILLLKYEKNESVKKELLKHVQQYMSRAEKLKEEIIIAKSQPVGVSNNKADDKKFSGMLSEAIVTEKPNVSWSDVAGLKVAKQSLKETVILPVQQPQLFEDGDPWKGILLYGPPGTGKSFLAKAVATEVDSTFFSISSADLVSKWQGETEKLIRSLFDMARKKKPSIVFIDEIDSMCGKREEGGSDASGRMKTQFLIQMDGVGPNTDQVLVLGATNLPWTLDIAMRRRFEKRIYIALPDLDARRVLFKLKLKKIKHQITDKEFSILAKGSDGFSGADIGIVAREATMMPVRKMTKAKFFKIDDGLYEAIDEYPPCSACPMQLSTETTEELPRCDNCGAIRMSLYDVPVGKAKKREMSFDDVHAALKNSKGTVKDSETKQYKQWTDDFGQDGN